jgi:hypothetical protein
MVGLSSDEDATAGRACSSEDKPSRVGQRRCESGFTLVGLSSDQHATDCLSTAHRQTYVEPREMSKIFQADYPNFFALSLG